MHHGRQKLPLPLYRSRGFQVALLCFQFFWLNIVIPGHRRGMVELPGGCAECNASHASADDACCASTSNGKAPPKGDPAAHCAICFFAVRVSSPPAIDMTHPPLRLVARVDIPGLSVIHIAEFIATYHACGPPECA